MNNAQSPHVQKAPANNTSQKPRPATTPARQLPATARPRKRAPHQPANHYQKTPAPTTPQHSTFHTSKKNIPTNHQKTVPPITSPASRIHTTVHARTKQANSPPHQKPHQDNSQPKLLHAHNTKPPTAKNQYPPLPRKPPETHAQSPKTHPQQPTAKTSQSPNFPRHVRNSHSPITPRKRPNPKLPAIVPRARQPTSA